MNKKIIFLLKERIYINVIVIIYIIIFYISYKYYISPNFSYQGFTYSKPELSSAILYFAIMLLPSFFIPSQLRRPSSFVAWMLYIIVYIPIQMVMGCLRPISFMETWQFVLSLLISMIMVSLVAYMPVIPIPKFRVPKWIFWAVLWTYLLAAYALLVKTFGFGGLASLSEVYDVRLKARDTLAQSGRLVGYQLRWISEAINPYFMSVGLSNKNIFLFFVGAIGQFLIYSFDATKSTLGSILLILAVFYLISKTTRIRATSLAAAFSFMLVVINIIDSIMKTPLLTGLLTRRIFAVPGLLTSFYYQYFSNHDKFLWTHTTIAKIFNIKNTIYPEYNSPGFLIGDLFFHNPEGNANANLWADAYANGGATGVIFITIILAIILWLYDSVSAKKDIRIALLLIAMPTFAITNTSLLTSLMSHGWVPAFFLMWYSNELLLNNQSNKYMKNTLESN